MASQRDEPEQQRWRAAVAERDAQPFVFVGEPSANITVTPRCGWAPRQERTLGQAPRNYPHNLTLVAVLTPTGLQAPVTLPSALNSDGFAASLAQVLVPTRQPGQIVILDELSGHKPRR